MSRLEQLENALIAADQAGNAGDAKRLADAVREERAARTPSGPMTLNPLEVRRGEIEEQNRGDIIDPLSQGFALGLSDELQGIGGIFAKFYADLTGNGLGRSEITGEPGMSIGDAYSGVRDEVRADTKAFATRNPKTAIAAEIAGGLPTAFAGAARLTGQVPTMLLGHTAPKMGVVGAGAAEGGLYGFGEGEGAQDSLMGAGIGAGMGAATAGLMDKILPNKIRSEYTDDLVDVVESNKAIRNKLYDQAAKSNQRFGAEFDTFVDETTELMKSEAMRRKLTPRSAAALKELQSMKGTNPTMKAMEQQRKIFNSALQGGEASDQRLNAIMKNQFDNFMEDNVEGQAGHLLKQARDYHGGIAKYKTLNEAWENSGLIDSGNFDKQIRGELKKILRSAKKRLGFSKKDLTVMRDIVEGHKGLNTLAQMSPSSLSGIGKATGIGYLFDPIIGGGLGGAGMLAEFGKGRRAERMFDQLLRDILGDAPVEKIVPKISPVVAGGLMGGYVSGE